MSLASTGLRNMLLGGSGAASVQSIFAAGFLNLYSGLPPATADAAIGVGNKLLLTYSIGGIGTGLQLDNTTTNVIQKVAADTWQGTGTSDAAGGTVATFYRFVPATNTTTLSTLEARVQGYVSMGETVDTPNGPQLPDLILGDSTIVHSTVYTLEDFSISMIVGNKSTGLCAALLGGAPGSDNFKDLFALCSIAVYAGNGTIPETADDDIGGCTEIVRYWSDWNTDTVGLSWDAPPASVAYIQKAVAETWKGTAGFGSPGDLLDAAFFRITIAGGTTTASSTEARYQGRVGRDASADMQRGSLTFVSGTDYTIPAAAISMPVQV